jgi:hypothetical protein
MKNADSHVILYAKGWYEKTNTIDDLKKIYSVRNGIDAEYITINNILSCLLKLTYEYITCERHFIDFIAELNPDRWNFNKYSFDDDYTYGNAVINKCLSVLSLIKGSDIKDGLDKPDENVLSIREDITEEKINEWFD